MRDMVEDGFVDERTAITESETEVSLNPVESHDRRRPDRDSEMDDVQEDYGVDDVEEEVLTLGSPLVPVTKHTPLLLLVMHFPPPSRQHYCFPP